MCFGPRNFTKPDAWRVIRTGVLAGASGAGLLLCTLLTACAEDDADQCADIDRPPPNTLAWSYVPPGTFTMGAGPERDSNSTWRRISAVAPAHEVTLTRGFFVMQTEVPVRLFVDALGYAPSYLWGVYDPVVEGPVLNGDYSDALLYANLLSLEHGLEPCYELPSCATQHDIPQPISGCGRSVTVDPLCDGYRLPSEAEWEYAARAGTTTATFIGNSIDEYRKHINAESTYNGMNGYLLNDSRGHSQCANDWGLFDMLGSGGEWVWDLTNPQYYLDGPQVDPFGLPRGLGLTEANAVVRGGAAGQPYIYATSWTRLFVGPDSVESTKPETFRLVRTAPPGYVGEPGPVAALPPPRTE
jgi:sulfatase modifying factor 1